MNYYIIYNKQSGEILQSMETLLPISEDYVAHIINTNTDILQVQQPVDNSKYYISAGNLTEFPTKPRADYIWNWTTMSWQDPRTEEQKFQQQAQQVLAERKKLLDSTDWIVVKAVDTGTPVPAAWQTYRQELRDVTNQTGYPYQVTWPTKPTN
jgi:hypothetical protein